LLGAGDDTFQWDPGDGSDVVEGQDGSDRLLFNGSAINEVFALSGNGARAQFTRNVANIVMDLDGVENIELHALGGADTFNISDLSATDVQSVNVDLAATIGGTTGDGLIDTVNVAGNALNNTFTLAGAGATINVTGLGTSTTLRNAETNDVVAVAAGAGNDSINATGLATNAHVTLDGGAGNDVIVGGSSFETLLGGEGNDTLTGGDGDDRVDGGAGNDRLIWNPGDDTDQFEGGSGTDTAEVNGGTGAETFNITANGSRVRFDRVNPAPFSLDIGTTENLVLNAGGGNDTISATGNLAPLIKLTLDGGAGNDTILGSNGNDVLLGGDGNDFIDGQQGNDTALLGAGDDTFQWDPGDGSDVVEGQDGFDTLDFNGANINERIDISANGGRVSFFRDIANVTMDLNDVESLNFDALGGADNINVGDLSGTDARSVRINLAATAATTAGDAANDTVTVNGGSGSDNVSLSSSGANVLISGLGAQLRVTSTEAGDRIVVQGAAGSDVIDGRPVAAGVAALTLDGGAGDDVLFAGAGGARLLGGGGDDVLVGGAGADELRGGAGNDILFGGAGNDLFSGDDDLLIVDFAAGAGAGDRLDLSNVAGIDDFGDVLASARGFSGGVVLDFGADEITLLGVNAAQLNADDFLI